MKLNESILCSAGSCKSWANRTFPSETLLAHLYFERMRGGRVFLFPSSVTVNFSSADLLSLLPPQLYTAFKRTISEEKYTHFCLNKLEF